MDKIMEWIMRHELAVAITVAIVVALLTTMLGSWWQLQLISWLLSSR